MVTRVVNGTITGGYTLDAQYNQLTISRTGVISGGNYGVTSFHRATIINSGSIINSSSASINLRAGGVVTNGSASDTTALINQGVYIFNALGTVNNFGTIQAAKNGNTSQYIFGVLLSEGGAVNNGSQSDYAAYIGGAGINITNASGTVKNFGRIEASGVGSAGVFINSGLVTNGSSSDTSALISGAATGLATSRSATASNFGTISSAGLGVRWAGGTLTNGPAGDTRAEIVGAYGISLTGAAATLKNFGSVLGTSGGAVYVGGIGGNASVSLTNGASNDTTALIMGASYGVSVNSAAATVTNYGTIAGSGGTALQFESANDLLIVEGGSSFVGTVLGGGGILDLAPGKGTIGGLGTSFSGFGSYNVASGGSWTLSGTNTLGTVTTLTNRGTMSVGGALSVSGSFDNVGSITGGAGRIVLQVQGGTLTNNGVFAGGAGGAGGVGGSAIQLAGGRLANNDMIVGGAGGNSGGDGGTAVLSSAGGAFTNGGTITGGAGGGSQSGVGGDGGTAVQMAWGSFTNSGVIVGGVGGLGGMAGNGTGGVGVYLSAGGQLINKGKVAGGAGAGGAAATVGIVISGAGMVDNFGRISGGAYSVDITTAAGSLKVETGSVLIGAVQGGGGTLELAAGGSGTITNLGAAGVISGTESVTFSGFGSYQLDTATSWTLAGSDALRSGTSLSDNGVVSSAGTLAVSGTISGTGSLTVIGGLATIDAGAAITVATLSINAGTTILNESLTYLGAFKESGEATLTLGNDDQLLLLGASHLTGLANGAGTVAVANATIGGFSTGGTVVLIDTGVVTQTGSVDNGGGGQGQAGLVIAEGATWSMVGGIVLLRGTVDSSLDVEGSFIGTCGTQVSRVESKTTDGGVIEAATGILYFTSALSGSGAIMIDAGATLQVESSVASTLSMSFNGPGATLAITHGDTSFAATIAGYVAGDSVDLLHTTATGASVNADDQLVIENATKTVEILQLSGNYVGATFDITSDGKGGTDVTLAGGPPPSPHAFVAAMAGFGPSNAVSAHVAPTPANAFRPTLLVREA